MKSKKTKTKLIFILVGLFLLSVGSVFAGGNELGNARTNGGNEVGNGGDLYAQEFTAIGRSLVARFREHPDSRIPDVDALERAVNAATVATKDKLELNGAEVDAINYPDLNRIELHRHRWAEYDKEKKAALVLHEYLGMSRADDSHYRISHAYSDLSIPQEGRPRVELDVHTQTEGLGYLKSYADSHREIGGSLAYKFSDLLSLGLAVDRLKESDFTGYFRTQTILGVFAKYNFPRMSFVQPFVSLGISEFLESFRFAAWDNRSESLVKDAYREFNAVNRTGAVATLGATIWLGRTVGFDAALVGGQVFDGRPLLGRYNTFYAGRAGVRVQL